MRKNYFCKATGIIAAVILTTTLGAAPAFAYNAGDLLVGQESVVRIVNSDDKPQYTFRADYDGYYFFQSAGDFDTYVTVYRDGEVIAENDDCDEGCNFKAVVKLSAGQEVTVVPRLNDEYETGSFKMSVEYRENLITDFDLSNYSSHGNQSAYLIDGNLVFPKNFQLYSSDMRWDDSSNSYIGGLCVNEYFVVDYLSGDRDSIYRLGENVPSGDYKIHFKPADNSRLLVSGLVGLLFEMLGILMILT